MVEKDRQLIEEYRATHPQCRWCIHNIQGLHGRGTCRVKDVEFRKNAGFLSKMRAFVCQCYSIK